MKIFWQKWRAPFRSCCWVISAAALAATISLAHADEGADKKRKVDIEFEEIDGATAYELKVIRVHGAKKEGKPLLFKTKRPVWAAQINPGKYMLQLRSYDERGVAGDWSDPFEYWVKVPAPTLVAPPNEARINAKGEDTDEVKFAWKAVPGATSYRIDIEGETGDIIASSTTEKLSHQAKLPVAKVYKWKVTSILPEGVDGDAPEFGNSFTLVGAPLPTPKIDKPLTRVVQSLTWDAVKNAATYDTVLFQLNEQGKWRELNRQIDLKANELPFDLKNPTGRYRVALKAKAPLRLDSPTARLEFDVKGGLRDPASIESAVLKESLEKPTNFYFIASYFITQISFASKIYDANTAPSFEAVGGTGRLGMGYQDEKSSWGAFGIVDLSGFNIANKNFTFASIEGHATWKLNWGGRGQSLIGAGLFSKELPILQGSAAGGFRGMGKVNNMGPHVGFQYWLPFNQKYGLQINARGYYTLLGKTDVGDKVLPALSLQYGVLGTYRLRSNMMGYAGYAYRKDEASFAADPNKAGSFAKPGDINLIQVEGHYLNLMLEYSY